MNYEQGPKNGDFSTYTETLSSKNTSTQKSQPINLGIASQPTVPQSKKGIPTEPPMTLAERGQRRISAMYRIIKSMIMMGLLISFYGRLNGSIDQVFWRFPDPIGLYAYHYQYEVNVIANILFFIILGVLIRNAIQSLRILLSDKH